MRHYIICTEDEYTLCIMYTQYTHNTQLNNELHGLSLLCNVCMYNVDDRFRVYLVIIFETSNVQHKSRRVYGKINQCLFYYFKGKFNGISWFMVIFIVNMSSYAFLLSMCVWRCVSEVLYFQFSVFGRCKLLLMMFLYLCLFT